MKKIDVGQGITILANIGVIAGILFLAVELQQNNKLLEAQARSERENVRRTAYTRYIENPQLVDAFVKANSGQSLTDQEEFVLSRANGMTIADWQFIYREYSEELLDERALPIKAWRRVFRTSPGLAELWEEEESEWDEEFVQWMNENIVSN